MASKTSVTNLAMTMLGEDRIIDLTDDTERATLANSIFDIVRDAELRAYTWNFSVRRVALAALSTAPAFRYTYQYQLPADNLRVLMVGDSYAGVNLTSYRGTPEEEWQIEGGKILTDIGAPLNVKYVASVSNVGEWDPLFVEFFAASLALKMSERLARSNVNKGEIAQMRDQILFKALRADAIENPPEIIADDSWMLSRL